MAKPLFLKDYSVLSDIRNYVSRIHQIDNEATVRVVAQGKVLAIYCAPLAHLTSTLPNLIGLRVFQLREPDDVDRLVPVAEFLDRIMQRNNANYELKVPPQDRVAAWAALEPPRAGWAKKNSISATQLQEISAEGVNKIAESLPENAGAPMIKNARDLVWGTSVTANSEKMYQGVAFLLVALGFLIQEGEAVVYENVNWLRYSTPHGHVLVTESKQLL
ncbi:MAG: hypothetical protein QM571_02805 [Micrococcaceae bacterium]